MRGYDLAYEATRVYAINNEINHTGIAQYIVSHSGRIEDIFYFSPTLQDPHYVLEQYLVQNYSYLLNTKLSIN